MLEKIFLIPLFLLSLKSYSQDIIIMQELDEIPIIGSKKVKTKKIGNYNGIATNFFMLDRDIQLITLIETTDTNLYLRNLTISALGNIIDFEDSIIVKLYSIDSETKKPDKKVIVFRGTIDDFYEKRNKLKFKLFKSYLKIPLGGFFISLQYFPVDSTSFISVAFNKKNKVEETFIKRPPTYNWESVDFDDKKAYNLKTWFEVYVE